METIKVVKEADRVAYSLYMHGKKVRTVTQEELADAERKMAISRLITKAEEYCGNEKYAFSDIKHPGRIYPIEQWPSDDDVVPGTIIPITEDVLDPNLFEWEEEED